MHPRRHMLHHHQILRRLPQPLRHRPAPRHHQTARRVQRRKKPRRQPRIKSIVTEQQHRHIQQTAHRHRRQPHRRITRRHHPRQPPAPGRRPGRAPGRRPGLRPGLRPQGFQLRRQPRPVPAVPHLPVQPRPHPRPAQTQHLLRKTQRRPAQTPARHIRHRRALRHRHRHPHPLTHQPHHQRTQRLPPPRQILTATKQRHVHHPMV